VLGEQLPQIFHPGRREGDGLLVVGAKKDARHADERLYRPFDATLHRLVVQPKRLAHREKRRVLPIAQQYPRSFDPTRRFGSRLRQPAHNGR
jgi:hypothetical protein